MVPERKAKPTSDEALSRMERTVCFKAEWYETGAERLRTFCIYIHRDSTFEMYEGENRKLFLRRTYLPDISPSSLVLGGAITIFARLLLLTAYGDEATAKYMEGLQCKGFVLVLPGSIERVGAILAEAEGAGFAVVRVASISLSATPQLPENMRRMVPTAGSAVAIEILADSRNGGWAGWSKLAQGFTELYDVYTSDTAEAASAHAALLFSDRARASLVEGCTLCLVKPHVLRARRLGELLSAIRDGGFEVAAMRTAQLDKATAAAFLSKYKGILPAYSQQVAATSDGLLAALQIRRPAGCADSAVAAAGGDTSSLEGCSASGISGAGDSCMAQCGSGLTGALSHGGRGLEGVVSAFREFSGPMDPEVARALRPRSLRARFSAASAASAAVAVAANAVHCTDLPQDAARECRFFFEISAAKGVKCP